MQDAVETRDEIICSPEAPLPAEEDTQENVRVTFDLQKEG